MLVDLENNQPTLEDVKRLVPDVTHAWLFYSPSQAKRLASFEPLGDRCTAVPISRPGKNALDFHLSFYVGYLAARNPDAKLVVVAIDRGYGPMIEHAVELDLEVAQVAFKPLAKGARKGSAKPVKRAAAGAAPKGALAPKTVAKKAPAKRVVAKTAVAKKAVARKAVAKTHVAKETAPQKAAAQRPAAKKATETKQVAPPAKKPAAAKKPQAPKPQPQVVRAAQPDSTKRKTATRAVPAKVAAPPPPAKSSARGQPFGVEQVIANLKKVAPGRRPKKVKQLRGHLSSLLGTDATDDKVTRLLDALLAADGVRLRGDTVVYGQAITGAAD
ncbi:MAG: hypothetical protein HZC37_00820 [Burkholderiales bacterium]|nr:hypothetical protein [Burkholderiales bacterium]